MIFVYISDVASEKTDALSSRPDDGTAEKIEKIILQQINKKLILAALISIKVCGKQFPEKIWQKKLLKKPAK